MGCRRNPTVHWLSLPLPIAKPSSWHVPAPEEPARLGGVRAAPPARLETRGVHVSAARVGEPRGHLAVPHQAPGLWLLVSLGATAGQAQAHCWAAEMTLPAEWPHPCPLLGPWWGVRRHWSWEHVCGKRLREQGPSPQGHRARLARVGGRGGIPQKLTCIGGFTLGLLPLPLSKQDRAGTSQRNRASSTPHRHGVQAAGQAGPEAASLHSPPQLQGRSGGSSRGGS